MTDPNTTLHALGQAVAEFCNAALASLDDPKRLLTVAALQRGAKLAVMIDLNPLIARLVLDDGHEPVELAQLRQLAEPDHLN